MFTTLDFLIIVDEQFASKFSYLLTDFFGNMLMEWFHVLLFIAWQT
jgi:hypothetical protein